MQAAPLDTPPCPARPVPPASPRGLLALPCPLPLRSYANCTDGALAELDRALSLARKYGMRVLLDMHGVRGSQNGFDNSGRMADIQWTLVPGMLAPGSTAPQPTFSHWAEQSPKWIGDFDRKRWTTVSLNWANVDWAVHTLCLIAGARAPARMLPRLPNSSPAPPRRPGQRRPPSLSAR